MQTPQLIELIRDSNEHFRILGGPPQTSTMRSGLVTLEPGTSVGSHNTKNFEELLIILEGEGRAHVEGQPPMPITPDYTVYIPPEKQHDVLNTGTTLLRYIYVVAQASRNGDAK